MPAHVNYMEGCSGRSVNDEHSENKFLLARELRYTMLGWVYCTGRSHCYVVVAIAILVWMMNALGTNFCKLPTSQRATKLGGIHCTKMRARTSSLCIHFYIGGSTGRSVNALRKTFVSYPIARDIKLGGVHRNLQAGASLWITIIQAIGILESAQVGVLMTSSSAWRR